LLLHNETVNVWTHLLGFLFFLYQAVDLISDEDVEGDKLPLWIQLITYQACMLASASFHLFACHSEDTFFVFRAMDHSSILVALYGTFFVIIWQLFACHAVRTLS